MGLSEQAGGMSASQRAMLMALCTLLFKGVATAQPIELVATSGASFEAGLPPAGSIASIFCTRISGVEQQVSATSFPLPLELVGIQVRVGRVSAPLFSITPIQKYFQINLQVPTTGNEPDRVEIRIEQGSKVVSALSPLRLTSPGDFFRTGEGVGVFQHGDDYSQVTNDNPARAGEIIVAYLTGLPEARPPVPPGEPSPSYPLAVVPQYSQTAASETYFVEIGGIRVRPHFIGLAPALAGVYQMNFVMPGNPGGNIRVQLARLSCRAIFGSCANGGGIRNTYRSSAVLLPSR